MFGEVEGLPWLKRQDDNEFSSPIMPGAVLISSADGMRMVRSGKSIYGLGRPVTSASPKCRVTWPHASKVGVAKRPEGRRQAYRRWRHCDDEGCCVLLSALTVNVPLPSDVPREITVESGDEIVTGSRHGSFSVLSTMRPRTVKASAVNAEMIASNVRDRDFYTGAHCFYWFVTVVNW